MKSKKLKKSLSVLYILMFLALAFMFFANDFGLVDLRKTSVIIGVALDMEEDEVVLTAQLAIPQPAENGENTSFNVVTGRGATVAAALGEVNVKTGYYPKLVFCKLILLGESCFNTKLNELLDYFFRNEYTDLTLLVASCGGKASELIAQQFPCGNSATDVIDKLLSSEAQASGNVATVSVKDVGDKMFSQSAAVYMPYLENGIIGGGGEEGGSGGGGGEGSGGGSGGASQQCEESELTCNKTAVFKGGLCAGILDETQTFGLNLLFNDVKHAFMESGEGEDLHVLGLRNCKGGVDLKFENGSPVIQFKFSSSVKVQDRDKGFALEEEKSSRVGDDILTGGEKTLSKAFQNLYETSAATDCDFLGIKDLLYKKFYDKYDQFSKTVLSGATVVCDVKLKSYS